MNIPFLKKGSSSKNAKNLLILHQIARDPYVDWVIIFSTSVVIATLLVVSGAYTYFDLNTRFRDAVNTGKASAAASIDTKALTKMLGQFDDRAKARQDIVHSLTASQDPSL